MIFEKKVVIKLGFWMTLIDHLYNALVGIF
jgi:hypothetical protein